MFTKLHFILAAFLFSVTAAYACKCVEFKQATAVMASPTMGSAYVTLVSDKNDKLTSLTSPCCDAVELHESSMKDGVMSMRQLENLSLTAGVPVEIAGGHGEGSSMHLMLIGIKKPFKTGQTFPIIFHFAKEKPHTALFTVVPRDVAEPSH